MFRSALFAPVVIAGLSLTSPVLAQSTVYIPAILELSGAGAVSGTNFRDGMLLAIDEINAKGGILGKKIDTPLLDRRPEPPSAAARTRMLRSEDVAACALLAINLPRRAVVEEILIRPP